MEIAKPLSEADVPVPDAPEPPPVRSVVASIPRRHRINEGASSASRLTLPPKRRYEASTWRVLRRLVAWVWQLFLFFGGNFYARLLGRSDIEAQAVRLRLMLETMGPTATKMGQQLSVRADLLPHQYCDELSKMLDSVTPFQVAACRTHASAGSRR